MILISGRASGVDDERTLTVVCDCIIFHLAQEDTRVDGGVAAYARAVEEAMEEYDVRHAHVDSRANIALRSSAELESVIRKHEEQWVAVDRELAEVSGMTAKIWEQSESLSGTIEMMCEVEEMLLEAEIGAELEALYKRRDDAELQDTEAQRALEAEIAHVMQLHDMLVSDAMTNQISSRTTEEIMAEHDLKKRLARLAKERGKAEADLSLKDIASSLDVASSMAPAITNDLDDFFTTDDGEDEDASGRAYTLYGMRARAESTKGAILGNQTDEIKSEQSLDVAEAERIALARKEALGISDEDMHGVNLKPPPPKGGAQDGPLEEAQSPRRIIIEAKSVTHQMKDTLKNIDLGKMWESASAKTAAAAERASAASKRASEVTAAAAERASVAGKDAIRAVQERAMGKTNEQKERDDDAPTFYKKDAGTST